MKYLVRVAVTPTTKTLDNLRGLFCYTERMKKVWAQKETGFTIVELLVVVVVIAILAAITVVSYNGIAQRAKDAAIVSTIDSWDKTLQLAAINGGAMPSLGACLGRPGDFTAKDGFPANACVTVTGPIPMTLEYDEADYAGWDTETNRPSGEMPIASYSTEGSQIRARGAWVGTVDPANRTFTIRWLIYEDGKCARGTPQVAPIVGSLTGGYCNLTVHY